MTAIRRIPGSVSTRSNAVVHNGLVYAVATAPEKSPSLYEQTKAALALLDASLEHAGTHRRNLLTATVYITDISLKAEMNRAWDEWVDRANAPQRACIGATLEGGDLVEIVAVAAEHTQ
jgi:enamine deaminase RidA (YjgF/YER057c/UK114 family)